ncbi:hypothetical protein KMZ93_12150 [Bradyrhizobium sediminis]|uniref:MFS transporter permease n=1 Tax=Bradyrhizobium sediminis TaxID=2840469 RepID=A0A975P4P6_9BRAD|nr:DUF6064 family protein [Bradyrhizobium sediminis]QWG25564.1 hypothetical protein KMZ93_12150 [Bradyrhizobium sediminis]
MLPFTPEQFLIVFVNYNHGIWPIQIAAYLLGGIAVTSLFLTTPASDRAIAGILAAMWLWTGFFYHGIWFAVINKAAYVFAALFMVQGCYLIYAGVYRRQIRFGLRCGLAAWAGAAFVVYAAIAYPLIGMATGHAYPAMPMFGVTPCPVTIFTFGMLLLTVDTVPRGLLVIPVVWSLIGGSAAILLNVPQDWLLLLSGCIAVALMVVRDRRAIQGVRPA